MSNSLENKRIVKNTVVLYIKLILSILIGLYTSRVILQALGASDYGLYTIVGGIVSMMNFLGITMMSVTYRYIVVEFGKGISGNPRKVFNTSFVIHLALVGLLWIVGETFGIYYIENVANIDYEKIEDALYVLHLSLLATSFVIMSVPFNGLIVAREKFVFTAVVEIGRTVLKLILVILLAYYMGNRLRLFAIIMALYNIILPVSMYIYCWIKDKDIIKWKFNHCKSDYKEILQYAFWIMVGAVASICQNQGANMIVNLFFNTVVNAGFGIAFQVNNYVMMFVQSLNQAAIPQIMKSQSGNDSARALTLIYGISKYAFFIMLIPTIPLILNMDVVLRLWLGEVPPFTRIFATVMLIGGLIKCLGAGFDSSIQATGKIRKNQIFYSAAYLSVLPISYILFKFGAPAYAIVIMTVLAAVSILIFQLFYLQKITEFQIRDYLKHTLRPCVFVLFICAPLFVLKAYWSGDIIGTITFLIFSALWIMTAISAVGLSVSERKKMKGVLYRLIRK